MSEVMMPTQLHSIMSGTLKDTSQRTVTAAWKAGHRGFSNSERSAYIARIQLICKTPRNKKGKLLTPDAS